MKASITKSKAGHWTVTIKENGKLIFKRTLIPSLAIAREILGAEKQKKGSDKS